MSLLKFRAKNGSYETVWQPYINRDSQPGHVYMVRNNCPESNDSVTILLTNYGTDD